MTTRQIRVDAEVMAELARIAKENGLQFMKVNEVLRWVLKLPPSKN